MNGSFTAPGVGVPGEVAVQPPGFRRCRGTDPGHPPAPAIRRSRMTHSGRRKPPMTHSRHRNRLRRVRCLHEDVGEVGPEAGPEVGGLPAADRLRSGRGSPRPPRPASNVLNESFRSWEVLNDSFKAFVRAAAFAGAVGGRPWCPAGARPRRGAPARPASGPRSGRRVPSAVTAVNDSFLAPDAVNGSFTAPDAEKGEGPAGDAGPSLSSRGRGQSTTRTSGLTRAAGQHRGATGSSEPVCRYVSDT
jgi:hypothetical protein